MAESQRDLADCVGAMYQAATDGASWLDVGGRMLRLFDAHRAVLRFTDASGWSSNLLMPTDASEVAYAAHFHRIDPYRARAQADFAEMSGKHGRLVTTGSSLVPDRQLLKSEYYNDFARHHERRHLIGGMAGASEPAPFSMFRADGAPPFAEREMRLLEQLLPHLQGALELRARLGRDRQSLTLTRSALAVLPFGVAIIDAGLKIHFGNDAACKVLADSDAGLYSIRSGPYPASGAYLATASREEASTLRRHVASVTSGGPGGSMRISSPGRTAMAVQIAPAPPMLADELATAGCSAFIGGLAILVMRPLERKTPPPLDMLCELFGFSHAEAEVAAALSGGATAEEVARQRGVSLVTVRTQVRSILGKSSSENLRDLERSMAALSALVPRYLPGVQPQRDQFA